MKIAPISILWANNSFNNINNNQKKYIQNPILNNNSNDVFIKSAKPSIKNNAINFMGYPVYIIDGGNHAKDMEHFTAAAGKDIEVHMKRTEDAPLNEYNLNKPLKNVEIQLHQLNKYGLTDEKSYVAVPVMITVSLENLAEQYKQVMGYYLHLKPHTILSQKRKLLEFLKVLYENPDKYRKYIEYMDPQNQGLEFAYGIIKEINNLRCKKVYVAADYPQEETLNWLSGERGENPELTNYLATGYDEGNKVHNMLNYIKDQGWYNFNLLALSDADVVNLKKMDGYTDHIYSSYDTTVKDGARGVYNLSPVRENGQIKGYSFKDTVTNEYPVEEFPYNDEVKDIAKFVGLSVDEAVADDEKTYRFKQAMYENRIDDSFSDKLYPVWKLFDENELRNRKIYQQGDFVDYKLEHFFRRNGDYKIIYPKGDCENSGRPSVKAMWGSPYSMLSAIKRDIAGQSLRDNLKYDNNININDAITNLLSNAKNYQFQKNPEEAARLISKAIDYIKIEGFDRKNRVYMDAYKDLADLKFQLGDYNAANELYNFYLNNLCKNYLEFRVGKTRAEKDPYEKEIQSLFITLAEVARKRGEEDNAKICQRAAYEVGYSRLGEYVIKRRADNDVNIGDIFV